MTAESSGFCSHQQFKDFYSNFQSLGDTGVGESDLEDIDHYQSITFAAVEPDSPRHSFQLDFDSGEKSRLELSANGLRLDRETIGRLREAFASSNLCLG